MLYPYLLKRYRAGEPEPRGELGDFIDIGEDDENDALAATAKPAPKEPVAFDDEPVKVKAEPADSDETVKLAPEPTAVAEEKPPESAPPAEKKPSAAPPAEQKPPTAPPAAQKPAAQLTPRRINPTATMSGGLSPAVVYLQNLKIQMEHFEKEIHDLRSQVVGFARQHDKEFELLLKRMVDFQRELHHEVHSHAGTDEAAPAPARAPEPAPKAAAAPSPVQEKPAPKAAAAPSPVQEKPAPKAAAAPSPVQEKTAG
ncbi:MAG: hypothetical protein ABII00_03415, partial [Elusimicrobiota bacterium]